jgi:hypothetical protein
MLRKWGLCAALLLLTGICSFTGKANAQCGGLYGGCGIYDLGRVYQIMSQNVPYFAAFPPVYYSMPVPRTYGYSPFAYPPGTMTPEIEDAPAPQEIVNPHLVPSASETASPKAEQITNAQGTARPLVVLNPYVESGDSQFQTAAIDR